MKEIVNRLHENKQIQLAKEILESNGYRVTKKLKEDASGQTLSSFAKQLASSGDALTLGDVRDNMSDMPFFSETYGKTCSIVASLLKSPEDSIYFIDLNDPDSLVIDIFNYLASVPEEDRTRLAHKDVDLEDLTPEDLEGIDMSDIEIDESYEYHAGIGLYKLNSTGEIFVSGTEYTGSYGEVLEFFYIIDNSK